MAIEASDYVVFREEPDVPRIEIDSFDVTNEQFESAATEYQTVAVPLYVEQFRNSLFNYDYAKNRLKKDLCVECEGMTENGIDYEHNTITLHEKADEIFAYAFGNSSMSLDAIYGIIQRFTDFYNVYYRDDANENFIVNPLYEETETYDTRAFTLDTTVGDVAENSIFILDAATMMGTTCTYTNYSGSNAQYKIVYDDSFELDSETSVSAWVIRTAGEEYTNIAYSIGSVLTTGMTWELAPSSPSSSESESAESSASGESSESSASGESSESTGSSGSSEEP